jgi:hypothetical protein
MREKIKLKFFDVKQKWMYVSLKSKVFSDILDNITTSIQKGETSSADAIDLIKAFKRNKKAWIKLISVKGRKNLFCLCEVITRKNSKIKTEVSCEFILNASLLEGTPKSLKLFKNENKSNKGKWVKPNDGFVDPSNSDIPIEEELTELGYQMYKEWHEEIKSSGLTHEEYKRKVLFPHGYTVVKVKDNW